MSEYGMMLNECEMDMSECGMVMSECEMGLNDDLMQMSVYRDGLTTLKGLVRSILMVFELLMV